MGEISGVKHARHECKQAQTRDARHSLKDEGEMCVPRQPVTRSDNRGTQSLGGHEITRENSRRGHVFLQFIVFYFFQLIGGLFYHSYCPHGMTYT